MGMAEASVYAVFAEAQKLQIEQLAALRRWYDKPLIRCR